MLCARWEAMKLTKKLTKAYYLFCKKNKTGNGERFIAGFFVGDRRNYILLFIKKGKNIVFQGVKFVRDYFTLYFYKLDKLDY